jgi:hypothetical protein
LRGDFNLLRTENEDLREKAHLQALIIDDITTATTAGSKKYVGNSYRDYLTTIQEIARKYEGVAEWGSLETGNIIDVRGAFIIGQGVAIVPADNDKKTKDSEEMKFVKAFMDYNDLDREMAQEFAKEGEIEGCFLGELVWNEKAQMVSLRFQSRVDRNYTIAHEPKDYASYLTATWRDPNTSIDTVLKEPDFVYARFGGRVHLPNRPMPKVGKCLTQIESIDKALRDWREINHLFAGPVPVIECSTAADAKAMDAAASNINWKLRKMVTIAGHLAFASPNLQGGSEALEKEIITNAKLVSGTTGVPIGFMGFGDLTTKLGSSSEISGAQIESSTSKERFVWIGKYTEIIKKAVAIRNANSQKTPLDASKVRVIIPFITAESWQRIIDVFLPLFTADAIDLSTLLAQIPNVDVDAEMEKQTERNAKKLERFNEPDEDEEESDEG